MSDQESCPPQPGKGQESQGGSRTEMQGYLRKAWGVGLEVANSLATRQSLFRGSPGLGGLCKRGEPESRLSRSAKSVDGGLCKKGDQPELGRVASAPEKAGGGGALLRARWAGASGVEFCPNMIPPPLFFLLSLSHRDSHLSPPTSVIFPESLFGGGCSLGKGGPAESAAF